MLLCMMMIIKWMFSEYVTNVYWTKKMRGTNPTGLSSPLDNFPESIALDPVKYFQSMYPMVPNSHWTNYIEIIASQTVKTFAKD